MLTESQNPEQQAQRFIFRWEKSSAAERMTEEIARSFVCAQPNRVADLDRARKLKDGRYTTG